MGIDFRQGKRSSHLKAIFELRLEQSEETSVQITEKEHFRPREEQSKCPRSSMEGGLGPECLAAGRQWEEIMELVHVSLGGY